MHRCYTTEFILTHTFVMYSKRQQPYHGTALLHLKLQNILICAIAKFLVEN